MRLSAWIAERSIGLPHPQRAPADSSLPAMALAAWKSQTWRRGARSAYYPSVACVRVLMKLYAAMVVGIAIGAGIALIIAARELEDAPGPPTLPTMPDVLAPDRPMGA